MKRKCPNCKLTKPESEFYRLKKTGKVYGQCKLCNKLYREKNKEKLKEYQKYYRQNILTSAEKKEYFENYRTKEKWKNYKKKYSAEQIKKPEYKLKMSYSFKKYYDTPKGKINNLKKRLKIAKKEITKNKIKEKITELQKQLENGK